jgi:hypothetical protein
MNARAAHVISAPSAMVRTIEKPELIFPEALMEILSRKSAPTKKFRTNTNPS